MASGYYLQCLKHFIFAFLLNTISVDFGLNSLFFSDEKLISFLLFETMISQTCK